MGKVKSPKPVSWAARQARIALGRNLLDQIGKKWPGGSQTFGFEKVGNDTGLSLSTLQRMAKGEVGATLDTIANIAYALGCSVAELTAEKDVLTGSKVEAPIRQSLQRIQRKK